jgi:hypothetical protein
VTSILTPDLECNYWLFLTLLARINRYLITFFGVKTANRFKT